jgi:DnaJ-class molecular chaperone
MLAPGGDPDTFKEINEAHDVLKDPKKREIYDRVGRDKPLAQRPGSVCSYAARHTCRRFGEARAALDRRGPLARPHSPVHSVHTSFNLRPFTHRHAAQQYGEEAIKEGMGAGGGGGGGSMADLFGELFGGGGRGGRARERRSDDVVHKLQVPLEDLYTGTTK